MRVWQQLHTPGPPVENEPPPPSRYCSTMEEQAPFTLRQPPANSKPSTKWVMGPARNCLQGRGKPCPSGDACREGLVYRVSGQQCRLQVLPVGCLRGRTQPKGGREQRLLQPTQRYDLCAKQLQLLDRLHAISTDTQAPSTGRPLVGSWQGHRRPCRTQRHASTVLGSNQCCAAYMSWSRPGSYEGHSSSHEGAAGRHCKNGGDHNENCRADF